jgi:hypothetical protein
MEELVETTMPVWFQTSLDGKVRHIVLLLHVKTCRAYSMMKACGAVARHLFSVYEKSIYESTLNFTL